MSRQEIYNLWDQFCIIYEPSRNIQRMAQILYMSCQVIHRVNHVYELSRNIGVDDVYELSRNILLVG